MNTTERSMSQSKQDIVLAFSGGLDTSFCVPWLQERGWNVHTVFADTGGVDAEERASIEHRAAELGVASHVTVDGGQALWDDFVKPFVWAGEGYQGQYPLLVSDRYLIVDAALARATDLGTNAIAHGCTGMGNDQVRFDLAVKSSGDYRIVAPVREIQKEHTQTRAYEQQYLEARGFGVRARQQAYTINENLLGLTMSGGEVDRWEAPGEGARNGRRNRCRSRCVSSKAKLLPWMAKKCLARNCWVGSTRCLRGMALGVVSTPAIPPSVSRAESCTRRPA
jgi:argininosuccinate synthase